MLDQLTVKDFDSKDSSPTVQYSINISLLAIAFR